RAKPRTVVITPCQELKSRKRIAKNLRRARVARRPDYSASRGKRNRNRRLQPPRAGPAGLRSPSPAYRDAVSGGDVNRAKSTMADDEYIHDEATEVWLPAPEIAARAASSAAEALAASGILLADGDAVVLTKVRWVKGAGQTFKQGTLIK